jgi:hypothetical protein
VNHGRNREISSQYFNGIRIKKAPEAKLVSRAFCRPPFFSINGLNPRAACAMLDMNKQAV